MSPARLGAGPVPAVSSWARSAAQSGITLIRPLLENTERPVPSRIPGERIEDHSLPELRRAALRRGHHDGIAAGVQDGRAQLSAEIARCGNRPSGRKTVAERPTRSKVPSQSVKKNSLLFLIGPPRLPPSMFRMLFGLSGYAGAILVPRKRAQCVVASG